MKTNTIVRVTLDVSIDELCTLYHTLIGKSLSRNEELLAKKMAAIMHEELHCE